MQYNYITLRPDRLNFSLDAVAVGRYSSAVLVFVGDVPADIESMTVLVGRTPDPTTHDPRNDFMVTATRGADGVFRAYMPPSCFPDIAELAYNVYGVDANSNDRWLGTGPLHIVPGLANAAGALPPPESAYVASVNGRTGEVTLAATDILTSGQYITIAADGTISVTLPAATEQTLGGVKQGTGCEIAPDGTLNVTGGGGSGTVDDTVTRASANPVKSSGIWSAIWGALTALPTGFTALYDWVVAQLAGKLDGFPCSPGHIVLGNYDGTGTLFDSGFAVDDIALAADLRYRIAEAAKVQTGWEVPDDWFPIVFTFGGTAYSIPLSNKGDVSVHSEIGGIQYLTCLADGVSVDVAIFKNGVLASETLDVEGTLTFNNTRPVVGATSLDPAYGYTVADHTVNLITASAETSIDIELPAAVTVDGVRYCRDFLLDVDNSANASDLALEFTGLGIGDDGYMFVTDAEDSIGDITTVGAGERARLYFTECAFEGEAPRPSPIFHVARVTLGAEIDEIPTTQGGNS